MLFFLDYQIKKPEFAHMSIFYCDFSKIPIYNHIIICIYKHMYSCHILTVEIMKGCNNGSL